VGFPLRHGKFLPLGTFIDLGFATSIRNCEETNPEKIFPVKCPRQPLATVQSEFCEIVDPNNSGRGRPRPNVWIFSCICGPHLVVYRGRSHSWRNYSQVPLVFWHREQPVSAAKRKMLLLMKAGEIFSCRTKSWGNALVQAVDTATDTPQWLHFCPATHCADWASLRRERSFERFVIWVQTRRHTGNTEW